MSLKDKVFAELRAKAKSYGFSKKELESAAATIADNLDLDENASDEEVSTAVTTEVDKMLPLLKLSQSAYGRMVKAYKDQHSSDDDSDDSDDNDDDDDDDKSKGKQKKSKGNADDDTATPDWAKSLVKNIETLTNEVTALKSEKLTVNRREKLNKLLKDTGIFGKTVMKNFDRMSFKDDDEFEEFYSEVEQDLKDENQERANKGLDKLGEPPMNPKKQQKVEEASDAELDEIANNF